MKVFGLFWNVDEVHKRCIRQRDQRINYSAIRLQRTRIGTEVQVYAGT